MQARELLWCIHMWQSKKLSPKIRIYWKQTTRIFATSGFMENADRSCATRSRATETRYDCLFIGLWPIENVKSRSAIVCRRRIACHPDKVIFPVGTELLYIVAEKYMRHCMAAMDFNRASGQVTKDIVTRSFGRELYIAVNCISAVFKFIDLSGESSWRS